MKTDEENQMAGHCLGSEQTEARHAPTESRNEVCRFLRGFLIGFTVACTILFLSYCLLAPNSTITEVILDHSSAQPADFKPVQHAYILYLFEQADVGSEESSKRTDHGQQETPLIWQQETAKQPHGEITPADRRPSESSNMSCGVTISDRFDCWPEFFMASESACEQRGCCWQPTPQPGVPYCFYPDNYTSYFMSSLNTNKTATLTRKSPSPYPNDVVELELDVFYPSEDIVHFRIFDPNNKRYEVPLNLNQPKPSNVSGDYKVSLQTSPFGIQISRKSTGATLFDSRNMAPLVFADQFIQIGTRLSTPYVYGLGEHQAPLHLYINWTKLVLWNRDETPDGGKNLYGSHPFYINMEEDGKAHGVFLFNSNGIEVALQPYGGGQGGLTYRTLGGILDFYVFIGPTPLQVVEQYVSLIGRPVMPPFWALGFHLCKFGYGSVKNVSEVIQRNRAAKIPYDVQWNDIDYMDAFKDWTYDANNTYAGLPELVDDLHAHNQRYVMIIDPGISVQPKGTYPPFDDGINMDIFIKNATGQNLVGKVWPGLTMFPDFFHPKADEYWFKQMQSYYNMVKYDGIWIDMNEISNFFDGSSFGCTKGHLDNPPYVPPGINGNTLMSKTICPSSKQFLSTNYNLHNLYGWSEMRSTAAGLRKLLGKRTFILSRSTFASSGHYGFHWTGDNASGWSDLYYSISSILKMNLFGVPMVGADTCGFLGTETRELCIRWMQLATFYPFMRNHNTLGSKDQDPASFDAEAVGYMRDTLNTRYSLLPFMYTCFYLSHTTGTPVVRPLFTMFPDTETIDKQFMWADALLISPALQQGVTHVDAYFPKGLWYDLYTGIQLNTLGEETLVLPAPINTINAHIRGGSIIPRLPPAVTTNEMRMKPFFLQVAPNEQSMAEGLLYWDDGESLDPVQTNKYSLVNFRLKGTTLSSNFSASNYPAMNLDMVQVFGVPSNPKSVILNGKSIASFLYDSNAKVLTMSKLSQDLLTAFNLTWNL